ncbi:lef-1 [Adoxophyes orana granulovirus]|uniref:Late expression factor 1 n=1 Tax=Adoxophyes orana granulovirus TaxID=170617 RepID=Q7T9V3_GVAO|nr:lef-1 [Adoxophyes orana granulovirus]AAP85699.1 lef-1 [Adoxophyes orana granulovirus]AJA91701.1 late expression factor 1 [Adoxophyes orana granulovirus]
MSTPLYTKEQLVKMWNSVRYKEDRFWAFMTANGSWVHSNVTYADFDKFYEAVRLHKAQDVHVKMLVDGAREWVIDVDHDENDFEKIKLKNMIAHATFSYFFGDNCTRIMYTGNRGLHIWLDEEQFDMRAVYELRMFYYENILKVTNFNIPRNLYQNRSMGDCFFRSVQNNKWIVRQIKNLYPHLNCDNHAALLKEFYPHVDKQVFVSNKQIRAPYSYNSKGKRFSNDHILLFE